MTSPQPALATLSAPNSAVSEAFRSLLTNLEFVALGRAVQTIVVSSPTLEESKSNTVANLAIAFAQGGRSVIVVDADLRRPRQHTLFGMANEVGLSDALLAAAETPLPLRDSAVEGLRLLSAGQRPPNPAELLVSPAMGDLIARLREQAEVVLFDTPPIVPVMDGALLGAQCDGLLLVMEAGKTTRDNASRARLLLDQVGATIIGTVLTNAKLDRSERGY